MNDKQLAAFVKRNADAISQSDNFMLIHNPKIHEELIPTAQMGMAVYLDKPILILCPESRRSTINNNLKRLAVAIEYFDDSLSGGELDMAMQAATMRLMDKAKAADE